jgi:prepilin peptidase CpaA
MIAAASDLKHRRIFNWLTLPAIALGLVASLVSGGLSGLGQGALGAAIALLAYGWLWKAGALGAGDVKLLMAFGALAGAITATGRSGIEYASDVAIFTLFVGGALAAILLVAKGRMGAFLSKLRLFALTATAKGVATEFPKADPALKMPFGIAIAIAACAVWFADPLGRWGLRPWK